VNPFPIHSFQLPVILIPSCSPDTISSSPRVYPTTQPIPSVPLPTSSKSVKNHKTNPTISIVVRVLPDPPQTTGDLSGNSPGTCNWLTLISVSCLTTLGKRPVSCAPLASWPPRTLLPSTPPVTGEVEELFRPVTGVAEDPARPVPVSAGYERYVPPLVACAVARGGLSTLPGRPVPGGVVSRAVSMLLNGELVGCLGGAATGATNGVVSGLELGEVLDEALMGAVLEAALVDAAVGCCTCWVSGSRFWL
jgi:hypothetical protein